MLQMIATATDLSTAAAIASVVVAVAAVFVAVYLGNPARRMARAQEQQNDFNGRLLRAVAGQNPQAGMSDEHPSMIDLLKETRDNTSDLSQVQAVMAHHIADGHGGRIPRELWRE